METLHCVLRRVKQKQLAKLQTLSRLDVSTNANMLEYQKRNLRSTLCRLIQECKNTRQLKRIHGVIITSPFLFSNDRSFLITRLLFVCALSNWCSLSYASLIFRSMENPNLSLYNIMIRACASKSKADDNSDNMCLRQPLVLYKQMLYDGISPDSITFPFLFKECSRRTDFVLGISAHCQAVKFGLNDDRYVQNSMISFYAQFGYLRHARKVFDEMSERDVVSWNSMIIAYLRVGDLDIASELFSKMDETRNIITWNSMITGFVQGNRAKEALEFFNQMQVSNVSPDKITIASVLSACAFLGAVDHGRWLHSYLNRNGLECDMVIGTALVDMYGKCGFVERAYEIFKEMPKKDSLAWTAMISVFALNGYANEAFMVFHEMEAEGMKPNSVTFVGLLSACAHSGFVEKGRWYFETMRQVYSIEPQVYHYACMVDILSRAGLFEEAEEVIRSMPMEPDVFVWGALLGGCQMHGNVELGESVAAYLIDFDPSNHAYYMNLSDLYGKAGRVADAKRTRALMKERGVKKGVPGCSLIEIDGIVNEFSVRGSSEVSMEELVWILKGFSHDMKAEIPVEIGST